MFFPLGVLVLALGSIAECQVATLSTTRVNFGNQAVGTTSSVTSVRLTNTGTAALVVSSITGPNAPFVDPLVGPSHCPITGSFSLAPRASCIANFTFSPTTTGTFTSTVTITDNGPGSPQILSLTGTGIPQVTLSTTNLNFGNIGVGAVASKNITLYNNLNAPLSFVASATEDFSVASNGCSSTIPALAHCSITLNFTPTQLGARAGAVTVTDSASNSPQTANLSGNGATSTVLSISATCASSTVSIGATDQCNSMGAFPGGISLSLTNVVDWASSAAKVASISNTAGSQGLATGKAAGTATIKAFLNVNETTKSASTSLTVSASGLITPTITWPAPAPITYGTALSSMQLDATASAGGTSVSGTFTYSPAAGTVPAAGTPTLSVLFTPTDTTRYTTASATVSLTINKAVATVSLSNLTETYNGSALTPTATTIPVGLAITWTGAADTNAGTYPVTATVNNPNYTGSASGSFVISPSVATVTANPASKVYGSADPALSANETGFTAADARTILISASRIAGESVGTYMINPSAAGTATTNYNITYQSANFTIAQAIPAFSGLTASQSITSGAASINLAGTISAGSVYPLSGEMVGVTINGLQTVATIAANGSFSVVFPTATIAASSLPYGITYSYAGDVNFAAATNSSTTLTVNLATATVVSIAITPANSSLAVGGTQQFAATGTLSSGANQDLTGSVTWTSSAPSIVGISNLAGSNGLATAMSVGVSRISATYESISGSASVAVNGAGNFVSAASLQIARDPFTATLLLDGSVLVAGGFGSPGNVLGSAELYNSIGTSTVPIVSPMVTPRADHTATLLRNGEVLLIGGSSLCCTATSSSELYNPTNQDFTSTKGSLNTARSQHTATLLQDGSVLVVGGLDSTGAPTATAEVYDPGAGAFIAVGTLSIPRFAHTATLLKDGTVLITGGLIDSAQSTITSVAEIYNPATKSFIAVTYPMAYPRAYHTATVLNDGSVLLAGGITDSTYVPTSTAEIYSSGSFSLLSSTMSSTRATHTATLLTNGMVLIAGGAIDGTGNLPPIGTPTATADLYDPNSGFSSTSSLNTARSEQTATLLTNGEILVLGGAIDNVGNTTAAAELYQPATLGVAGLQSITITPANPSITVGSSQQFIATGNFGGGVTQQLTSVIWTTQDLSGSNIASVSNDVSNAGMALGLSQGVATITATSGVISNKAQLNTYVAASLTLSPTSPNIALGTTQQLTATVTLSNGVVQDVTSFVTWTCSAPCVATIDHTGLAKGVLQGTSTISATFGPVSGTTSGSVQAIATLMVGPPALSSILVTPSNPFVQVGLAYQLTATGTFSDDSSQDVTNLVTWSSLDTAVAIVNASGSVSAVSNGMATIQATDSGVTGSTILTASGVAATGNLNVSRDGHTATLLDDGEVLVTGGAVVSSIPGLDPITGTMELYSAGTFNLLFHTIVPRYNHTATLLNDGTVLLAGGSNSVGAPEAGLTAAEIYNPPYLFNAYQPNSVTMLAGMNDARNLFTATLLHCSCPSDGMVLMAGGSSTGSAALGTTELYNPATQTFAFSANMTVERMEHAAALLDNGKVLIVGGLQGFTTTGVNAVNTAEIYDPVQGIFTPTTRTPVEPRLEPTATLLNNGKVLITGGEDPNTLTVIATAELYDPTTDTFTATGNMNVARASHTATLLENGMVLVSGGGNSSTLYLNSQELYDPSTGTFTLTDSLQYPRYLHTATRLTDGSVLIAGGINSAGTLAADEISPAQNSAAILTAITLTPTGTAASPVPLSVDATIQFIATGLMSDGSLQQLSSIEWSSSDSNIVKISNSPTNPGLAVGSGTGLATITACIGTRCGSTIVNVP